VKCIDNKLIERSLMLKNTLTIIDMIPVPIFYKDLKGIYVNCNSAFADYLGRHKEEIIGFSVYEVHERSFADLCCNADGKFLTSGEYGEYEADIRHKDGSLHNIVINSTAIKSNNQECVGFVGTLFDISYYKKNERYVRQLVRIKEAMLKVNQVIIGTMSLDEIFELILDEVTLVMDHADLASILLLNDDNYLTMVAQKGFVAEKVKDFKLKLESAFVWQETGGNIAKAVIINDIHTKYIYETPELLENTEGIIIKSSLSAPIRIGDRIFGLINIDCRDSNVFNEDDIEIMEYMRNQIAIAISKHNIYEETVYLSRHDKLTGLYNRRYFEELFETCVSKAVENEEQFLLVIFDLNNLKEINDNYGHLAGDEIIKDFSRRLKTKFRTSDVFARLGGDEFIALFYDTVKNSLVKKINGLNIDLNRSKVNFQGTPINSSFSYGISAFGKDGTSYKELVKIADKRMYENKKKQDRIEHSL